MPKRDPESLKRGSWVGLKNSNKKKRLSTNRKNTGEKKTYGICKNTRPHICSICKKFFNPIQAWCFAHVLAKKNRPKQRLNTENILLVCSIDCHNELDRRTIWYRRQILEILEAGWTWKEVLTYINEKWLIQEQKGMIMKEN